MALKFNHGQTARLKLLCARKTVGWLDAAGDCIHPVHACFVVTGQPCYFGGQAMQVEGLISNLKNAKAAYPEKSGARLQTSHHVYNLPKPSLHWTLEQATRRLE